MKPLIFLLTCILSVSLTAEACSPLGMSQAELKEVSSQGFNAITISQTPDFLAEIVSCLSSTDPFLRDSIAYEGTMTLLRREEALNEALSGLPDFTGKLNNIDLSSREGIKHVNIEKQPDLQDKLVKTVLKLTRKRRFEAEENTNK